jgi:hypothetical protein
VKEPIRKIELKDGTVRYRLVVDIGHDENGKRQQITRTFDKLKEARDELSKIRHETNKGTYVKPSEATVSEYLDEYFVGATRGRRESTKVSYRDAFRPVRERLGTRNLQSVTKADIERLVDWMLTEGRKRGGKPGTGLGPRSVRLTLGRLKAAFEMAMDEGRLTRNVVKLVTPPEYTPKERHLVNRPSPEVPADRDQGPATRRVAPEPVRATPRRGARPAMVGYRPQGQDPHRQPGARPGGLQGPHRATKEPERQADSSAR